MPTTQFAANETRNITVLGSAGIPTTGVEAVVLDVEATATTATSGAVQVWRTGDAIPGNATLHVDTDSVPTSNTVVVQPNSAGQISIKMGPGGSSSLNIDVQGYFSTGSGGGFTAHRSLVVDSATAIGISDSLVDGSAHDLQVTGTDIPDTATAVFANVSVIGPDSDGSLQFYARGGAPATAKHVQYSSPSQDSTGTIIPLDSTGGFAVKNSMGSGDIGLKIEVMGYFEPSNGATFAPISQVSLEGGRLLAAGASYNVAIGGTNGLPTYGVEGAVLNVHTKGATTTGGLKIWTAGFDEVALPTLRYAGTTSAPTDASTATIVRPGQNGMITILNTGSQPVEIKVVLEGWFASERVVTVTEEASYISDVSQLGIPQFMAKMAVWDQRMLDTLPASVATETTSALDPPLSEWAEVLTEGTQDPNEQPAEAFPADTSTYSAANGDCDPWRIGRYNTTARFESPAGNLLWSNWLVARWCYDTGSHRSGIHMYWAVHDPNWGGGLATAAWNYSNTIQNQPSHLYYQNWPKGSVYWRKVKVMEYCVPWTPVCAEMPYRYWFQGMYDGSKRIGWYGA